MPLHCAAIRPKFLNVPSVSFPNPVTYWLGRATWESNITIFIDFLSSSVFSLALWCRLVEERAIVAGAWHLRQTVVQLSWRSVMSEVAWPAAQELDHRISVWVFQNYIQSIFKWGLQRLFGTSETQLWSTVMVPGVITGCQSEDWWSRPPT